MCREAFWRADAVPVSSNTDPSLPIFVESDSGSRPQPGGSWRFVAIFRQSFAIESPFPMQDVWKRLLAVTKTDRPTCAGCGHTLTLQEARFCSSCGQPASPQASLPKPWLLRAFSSRHGFEFEGSVSPEAFRISRIISYRNSCIPIISGRFEPSGAGTRIVMEMTMHPLGYVLLIPGMGLSFLVPVMILAGGTAPSSAFFSILPFAAPCVIGGTCFVAFAGEAATARGTLSRIWQAESP
jgi:hypothetical protein